MMRSEESYESAAIGLALACARYSKLLGIMQFRIADQARTKEGERALSAIALVGDQISLDLSGLHQNPGVERLQKGQY